MEVQWSHTVPRPVKSWGFRPAERAELKGTQPHPAVPLGPSMGWVRSALLVSVWTGPSHAHRDFLSPSHVPCSDNVRPGTEWFTHSSSVGQVGSEVIYLLIGLRQSSFLPGPSSPPKDGVSNRTYLTSPVQQQSDP